MVKTMFKKPYAKKPFKKIGFGKVRRYRKFRKQLPYAMPNSFICKL